MTSPSDVVPAPESQSYAKAPFDVTSRQDDRGANSHQEINARRARVENPEMLTRLRSL